MKQSKRIARGGKKREKRSFQWKENKSTKRKQMLNLCKRKERHEVNWGLLASYYEGPRMMGILTTALKRVDLPTLGRPTMPALRLMLIFDEEEEKGRHFPVKPPINPTISCCCFSGWSRVGINWPQAILAILCCFFLLLETQTPTVLQSYSAISFAPIAPTTMGVRLFQQGSVFDNVAPVIHHSP